MYYAACTAAQLRAFSLLVQSAKHANADGNTSLHWACLNGHADVAALLLARGAHADGGRVGVDVEQVGGLGAGGAAAQVIKELDGALGEALFLFLFWLFLLLFALLCVGWLVFEFVCLCCFGGDGG